MRKIGHITRLIPYMEAADAFNALHLLSLYKGLSLYNIVSLPENKTLQEKRQRSSGVAMTHTAFHQVTILC